MRALAHTQFPYLSLFFLLQCCPAGIFRGGYEIMVRSKFALADGVTMQLTVRTTHEEVAELVTSVIG